MSIGDNETNEPGIRKNLIPAMTDNIDPTTGGCIPDNIAQIMESVDVECGLCANEGADDIAGLLREVYAAMSFLVGKVRDMERELAAVTRERDELRAKLAEAEKDARRLSFLHDQCSVNFLFKREDGSSAHILGPTNLRAAIDAAMDAERG